MYFQEHGSQSLYSTTPIPIPSPPPPPFPIQTTLPTTVMLNYHSITQNIKSIKYKIKRIGTNAYITEHSGITTSMGGAYSVYFKGELHNYLDLFHSLKITPSSNDPEKEIIILLYIKFGFEYMMSLLVGRFSVILFDNNVHNDQYMIYVAVDVFSYYPVSILYENNIILLTETLPENETSAILNGGSYSSFKLSSAVHSIWEIEEKNKKYFHFQFRPFDLVHFRRDDKHEMYFNLIKKQLRFTIKKIYNYHHKKYGGNIHFTVAPPQTEYEKDLHKYFEQCICGYMREWWEEQPNSQGVNIEMNYDGFEFLNEIKCDTYLDNDYELKKKLENKIYIPCPTKITCSPLMDIAFLQMLFVLPCQYRCHDTFIWSIINTGGFGFCDIYA